MVVIFKGFGFPGAGDGPGGDLWNDFKNGHDLVFLSHVPSPDAGAGWLTMCEHEEAHPTYSPGGCCIW